jgi:hypothetical protein
VGFSCCSALLSFLTLLSDGAVRSECQRLVTSIIQFAVTVSAFVELFPSPVAQRQMSTAGIKLKALGLVVLPVSLALALLLTSSAHLSRNISVMLERDFRQITKAPGSAQSRVGGLNFRPRICYVLSLLRIHRSDCEHCMARLTCGDELRKRLDELNEWTQPPHEKRDSSAAVSASPRAA